MPRKTDHRSQRLPAIQTKQQELDKQAAEADSMVDPAKVAERAMKWGSIFTKVMEDAPWAPVFNEQRFTMHSPRMGGDPSLFVDPVHIPIAYDHVFVTDAQ